MSPASLTVPREARGERLDQFLSGQFPELSRSQLQRVIERGGVLLGGKAVRSSERLKPNQLVEISFPDPEATTMVATPLDLNIVYEDEELLVVDKPAGLVVHPAPGHPADTLVNGLLARYPNLAVGGALRPGIVHRLDKGTSGLMVVARSDRAYHSLIDQMKRRVIRKEYLALAQGLVEPLEGVIDAPIGRDHGDRQKMAIVSEGRSSRTGFRVIERFSGFTLLRLVLETGRTHQIRVHLAGIGHPVVGDSVYGSRRPTLGLDRPFLHAWHLGFERPEGGSCLVFWAPLPADLTEAIATVCQLSS